MNWGGCDAYLVFTYGRIGTGWVKETDKKAELADHMDLLSWNDSFYHAWQINVIKGKFLNKTEIVKQYEKAVCPIVLTIIGYMFFTQEDESACSCSVNRNIKGICALFWVCSQTMRWESPCGDSHTIWKEKAELRQQTSHSYAQKE